jgi:hypothetical protein
MSNQINLIVHKMKKVVGKATVSEWPEGYIEKRDQFYYMEKTVQKIINHLRNFCVSAESTSKIQSVFGEKLSKIGLKDDSSLGEAMIKMGEGIKSMATMLHAMYFFKKIKNR